MADSYSIKVVCRVRPLNSKERSAGNSFVINFPTTNVLCLGHKTFQYDGVLRHDSTQQQVYNTTAQPLVKDVLNGYNTTIFAYGQTSSGKTHTMEGDIDDPEMRGIIPRLVQDLFNQIYEMDTNLELHIKVSYFELYMEKIRDLLDITKVNLPIHENKQKVPYVKGVTERFVTSPEEILAAIEEGKANRHVSVTNMNAHSSRSHAVFLISVKQVNKETQKTLTGKLFLVDLAGSEKVEKTNAQGLTLDEAKTINKSLLALSNVISKLSEGTKSHIPYRDSKLTRVLQESLGGNARTTLIICCSPSSSNESETKGTLHFGERAKMIKNKVEINVELTAEEWRKRYEKQKEETDKVKAMLQCYAQELQKWRKGEAVSVDEQIAIKVPATVAVNPALPLASATPTIALEDGSVAMATGVNASSSVTDFEEERARLYQQLDEKDEEIHQQTQKVETLSLTLKEMSNVLEISQDETRTLQEQIAIVERDLSHSQEEVQEVMQALEELAVSYDAKDLEIQTLQNERDSLVAETEVLQANLDSKEREMRSMENVLQDEHKKHRQALGGLLHDLSEMGTILGSKTDDRLKSVDEVTLDDLTRIRVFLSNMRIEARTLTEQRNILEQAEREAKRQAEVSMRELNSSRLRSSELEARSEALYLNVKEIKGEKEELERALLELNDQVSSLRAQEREALIAAEHDRRQEAIQKHLEAELKNQQESYQKQISILYSEINSKEQLITELQENQQRQELIQLTLQNELMQLQLQKEDYIDLSNRLSLKERAELDYSGLMDTVKTEMSKLDLLKKALYEKIINKLSTKHQKSSESLLMRSPDRGEMKFLEKNLEELSRSHKKTLSSFAEIQRDLAKHQSLLEIKTSRVKELETILKDTREAADREYCKLNDEKEQMRLGFLAKLKERERAPFVRRQGPTIVRPVPRPQGAESVGGASPAGSREALLAVAGVHIVGHSKRSPLLDGSSLHSRSNTQNGNQSQTRPPPTQS